MDLDDIFDQGHKRRNQSYDHNYRHEDNYQHEHEYKSSHSYDKQNDIKLMMLDKLRNNPKLKMLLIVCAIIFIVIAVGIVVLLFPFILKTLGFVSENGVEGVLNTVWKGTK